jgi:hypothetical protein
MSAIFNLWSPKKIEKPKSIHVNQVMVKVPNLGATAGDRIKAIHRAIQMAAEQVEWANPKYPEELEEAVAMLVALVQASTPNDVVHQTAELLDVAAGAITAVRMSLEPAREATVPMQRQTPVDTEKKEMMSADVARQVQWSPEAEQPGALSMRDVMMIVRESIEQAVSPLQEQIANMNISTRSKRQPGRKRCESCGNFECMCAMSDTETTSETSITSSVTSTATTANTMKGKRAKQNKKKKTASSVEESSDDEGYTFRKEKVLQNPKKWMRTMKSDDEKREFGERLTARYVRPFGANESFTRSLMEKIIRVLILIWVHDKKEEACQVMVDILEAGRQIATGKTQEDMRKWWAAVEAVEEDDRYKAANKKTADAKNGSKKATDAKFTKKTYPAQVQGNGQLTVPRAVWNAMSAEERKGVEKFRKALN